MAYNKRITISRRTVSMVGGEAVETWADLCSAFAKIDSRVATAAFAGSVVQSIQRFTVCASWSQTLNRVIPGDIITLDCSNGQQLQIDSVINRDQRCIEIEFGATELVPVGAVAP